MSLRRGCLDAALDHADLFVGVVLCAIPISYAGMLQGVHVAVKPSERG